MTQKTVKVDQVVHRRLEETKKKHNVDTFNEALKHELGIISDPDVDELAAFLQDDLKGGARQVMNTIREIGNFEERVRQDANTEILEFVGRDSKSLIATMSFNEDDFKISYRAQGGLMEACGRGQYSLQEDEVKYGTDRYTKSSVDIEEVIKKVENRVSSAYNRWEKE